MKENTRKVLTYPFSSLDYNSVTLLDWITSNHKFKALVAFPLKFLSSIPSRGNLSIKHTWITSEECILMHMVKMEKAPYNLVIEDKASSNGRHNVSGYGRKWLGRNSCIKCQIFQWKIKIIASISKQCLLVSSAFRVFCLNAGRRMSRR